MLQIKAFLPFFLLITPLRTITDEFSQLNRINYNLKQST